MNFKKFSPIQILITLAVLALLAAIAIPRIAQAQGYFTNNPATNGAYLPNSAAANAYPAYVVQKFQLNNGIQAGSFTTLGSGKYTNTFNTTYVYTAAPAVSVTQVGATVTATNLLLSVTPTNFIYQSGVSGTVASFTVIGH